MKLKLYVVAMQARNYKNVWVWMTETYLDKREATAKYKQNKSAIKMWKGEYQAAQKPQEVTIEVTD